MHKRQIALLGSTGSIGTQALDVVRDNTDRFEVYALVARQNVDLLAQQAREFRPEVVVIADEQYYAPLKEALADLPMKVWAGADAIADVVQMAPVDVVLTAMVGYAGLRPTLAALEAGKAVALANKDIGYLPGSGKDKVAPYMQPLFDNLNVIRAQLAPGSKDLRRLDELQKSDRLVIEALAFIRGRSLSETFCIVDEAQNLTPHEIKTIITRTGEGTKMVFTGDIEQIDSPYLDAQSNGLAYMIDKMRGERLFAHVNLVKGERSALAELASERL